MVFYTARAGEMIKILNGQIRVMHSNATHTWSSLACSKKALCSAIRIDEMNSTYLSSISNQYDQSLADVQTAPGAVNANPGPGEAGDGGVGTEGRHDLGRWRGVGRQGELG